MTSRQRRKFTKKQKESALRRLEAGASAAKVAADLQVAPNAVLRWRQEARKYGARAFLGYGTWRSVVQRKTHQIVFNITQDEYERLLEACATNNARSISSFARAQLLTNDPTPLLVHVDNVLDKLAATLSDIEGDTIRRGRA
jgi:transposase-like protein